MYSLTLSNDTRWWLEAGDNDSEPIVEEVAAAMGLSNETAPGAVPYQRLVQVFWEEPQQPPNGIPCLIPKPRHPDDVPFLYYFHTALALAHGVQKEGGLLVHAAMAEYQANRSSNGFIFSAPGGTGKSTTSRRLPAPWKSWSDDACLIVPQVNGRYNVHPWPTWSRYLYLDQTERRWDVQSGIPLSACVFLKQASNDSLEPIGAGQTASLLTESARQINYWDHNIPAEEKIKFRLVRFDNICKLAKAIPAYLLHISLDGNFWHELESLNNSAT